MRKNGLDKQPHRIYNADETGFELDPQKKKIVTFTKMNAPATSVRKGTRDHITSMECVAADGSTIPPLIIFSKSYPSTAYNLEGPDNALYATTPSGFIESDVFLQWLEKCFVRFCSPERPVMLLLDQHSTHVTREAIDLAIKEDIVLLGLPPHSSHFLQPLDAQGGPFLRMKSSFEDVVNDMTLIKPNFFVTKSSFPRIIKGVRERTLTMSVIKTGFKKTGIYPVNKEAISDRWLRMNDSSACPKEEDKVIDKKEAEDRLLPEELDVLRMAEEISDMQADQEDPTGRALLEIEVEMLELAEKISAKKPPVEKKTSAVSTCTACGSRLTTTNPFVQTGVVPAYVADLLTPIPDSQKRKSRKVRPKALVFDQEYIETLEREKQEKEDQKCEEKLKKKEEREEKKRKKMEEMENQRKARLEATQKRREEKQRKKMEELELKRKERLEIRQKRKEEALAK
ncbi:uncharacterized protein [Branchiostoma lanceolatum]|uniref:uncharacterized protein n=1 Tax=Branchiostoma lanceolatum TaxID=7740 RepID=UPI0034571B51